MNLSGHFRLIQAVIGGMRALGHGRIIVIASGWGVIGHPNATAYAASKSGLIALTKGLGRELGPDGILANAIAPAFIDTEQLLVDAADAGISLEEMRQRYRDLVPVGQLATTDDIAAAISFLAGPGAAPSWGRCCSRPAESREPAPDRAGSSPGETAGGAARITRHESHVPLSPGTSRNPRKRPGIRLLISGQAGPVATHEPVRNRKGVVFHE